MIQIDNELLNNDYVFTHTKHMLNNNVYSNEAGEKVVDICK